VKIEVIKRELWGLTVRAIGRELYVKNAGKKNKKYLHFYWDMV